MSDIREKVARAIRETLCAHGWHEVAARTIRPDLTPSDGIPELAADAVIALHPPAGGGAEGQSSIASRNHDHTAGVKLEGEAEGLLTRNPAPDAAAPMVPSPSKTIGIRYDAERGAIVAASHAGAEGWQDLASAPKDGTHVLLWIVHRNAAYSKFPVGEGWEGPSVGWWINFKGGERVQAPDGSWTWHGLAGQITHWHPLPPPPSPEGEQS